MTILIFYVPCRKYEELKAPPVERFRELTANTYTSVDVR